MLQLSIPPQVILLWGALLTTALLKPRILAIALLAFDRVTLFLLLTITVLIGSSLWFHENEMMRLSQLASGFVLALLASAVWTSKQQVVILLSVVVVATLISGLVAIAQSVLNVSALWTWTKYSSFSYGATGFEDSPVTFGYSALGGVVVVFGSLAIRYYHRIDLKVLPGILATSLVLVFIPALVLINSRSTILGIVLSMILVSSVRFGRGFRNPVFLILILVTISSAILAAVSFTRKTRSWTSG